MMSDSVSSASGSVPLPEGWRMVTFGEVARNVNINEKEPLKHGITRAVGLEHLDPCSLRITRWGEITDEISFTRRFSKGQILFGKRRAYQRKAALAEFDGICSSDILVFEARSDVLIPELLPFIVQSDRFFEFAINTSSGSLSPRTKWKDLAAYTFPLPPIDEQCRIAEILWAAEDVIVKNEAFVAEVEHYKQLMMRDLFRKGIGHEEFQEIERIGMVARGWKSSQLKEVVSITNGQVDPKVMPYKSMIHIGPEDIESRTGRIISLRTNEDLKISSGNYYFDEHDILYSKIRPYLVKVAFPHHSGTCSADIYPLKPDKQKINPDYLFQYLLSQVFTTQAISFQNRTGMPKINREEFGIITVPLPPLPEQRQIAAILSSIDDTIAAAKASVEASKALKIRLINEFLSSKRE